MNSTKNAITDQMVEQVLNTGRDISIKVLTAPLPETIHAFVTQRDTETYWIFLNSNKSETQQAASFVHECLHIYHRDTERQDLTADQIEALRHSETVEILQELRDRKD